MQFSPGEGEGWEMGGWRGSYKCDRTMMRQGFGEEKNELERKHQ